MRLAIPIALFLAVTAAPRQGCGNGTTPPAYDACAGKACGASCTECPPDPPTCIESAVPKACDAGGHCVAAPNAACPP